MPDSGQNCLIVPIQINALYLESDQTVMDAKADFSRLPWSNGQEDFNADTPFLGEAVLSPPFQNKNFTLAAGVHLHWVLPRAHRTYHTAADSSGKKKAPYAAPNRWLIKRGDGKEWVVESDYIDKEIKTYNKDAVTVPVFAAELPPKPGAPAPDPQPFRYLGRQMPYDDWSAAGADTGANYWSDEHNGQVLSAFGYGEVSFNTFYPNCRSVFGFYDDDPGDLEAVTQTYEILGWYAESENDIVTAAIAELNDLISNPEKHQHLLQKMFVQDKACPDWLSMLLVNTKPNPLFYGLNLNLKNYDHLRAVILEKGADGGPYLEQILDYTPPAKEAFMRHGIRQVLNWKFSDTSSGQTGYPTQSIYYSSVTVSGDGQTQIEFDEVIVGNSGSEALSAYLAKSISGDTADLENSLNAILHGSSFQGNLTDAHSNFQELLHESGFEPKQSGTLWRIRKMAVAGEEPKDPTGLGQMTLPEAMAGKLNDLNVAQAAFNKGLQELENLQRETYAAWCKFMICAYPPLGTHNDLPGEDEVGAFASWKADQAQGLKDVVGSVTFGKNPSDSTASGNLGQALLAAYTEAYNYLNSPLRGANHSINEKLVASEGKNFELSQVPAPRYYQPKDPVLVFVAKPHSIENFSPKDPNAPFKVLWNANLTLSATGLPIDPDTLKSDLPTIAEDPTVPSFESDIQVSTPQILEWVVDYFPVANGVNINTGNGNYNPDFLQSPNFDLSAESFDFTQNGSVLDKPQSYSGSTYISTGAQSHIQSKFELFLLSKYPDTLDKETDFEGNKISKTWKEISGETSPTNADPGYVAYQAYNALTGKYLLTQSIGGFNQALLQLSNNVRVPIANPLGFKDEDPIVANVKKVLKDVHPPASNPDNIFMPLRAGGLHFNDLRLVDHFGRYTSPVNDASSSALVISKQLQMSANQNWLWLGPRFTQATRLNFRWLAAVHETGDTAIEMNSHPATSPVCGWVMPNYLENSLFFYDHDGKGLGSFQPQGTNAKWSPFPGDQDPITKSDLTNANPRNINTHLLKLMMTMSDGTLSSGTALTKLIGNMHTAQDKIYPENYAGHDALSILMGKPMAVVRASLGLEVLGGILDDQGWIPFQQQLQGQSGKTDAYEQVQVSINLGDPHQLNDGLVGYWQETTSGYQGDAPVMITHNQTAFPVKRTLADEPVTLTMLVDPHGVVHASAGVLPVKVIDIPPDQYTKALKNIEMAFFTAPLLTSKHNIQLSLPKETGYQWSWLQQEYMEIPVASSDPFEPIKNEQGLLWKHTPDVPLIDEAILQQDWNALAVKLNIDPLPDNTILNELTTNKWLSTTTYPNTTYYLLLPVESRVALADPWKKYEKQIDQLILKNLRGMNAFNTNEQFESQRLLEGWLMLSQQKESNTSES